MCQSSWGNIEMMIEMVYEGVNVVSEWVEVISVNVLHVFLQGQMSMMLDEAVES